MAVFRIKKTKNYTVMSNHHLRNTNLSLKAKGLLSLMLSLPEEWDYTTKGLSVICKDGVDSITSAIKELEAAGYVVRERVRNEKGQLTTAEYSILEEPISVVPEQEKPKQENPILDKPIQDKPILEKHDQLNTNILNKDLSITDESNPIKSNPEKIKNDRNGMELIQIYKKIIKGNIDYDVISRDKDVDKRLLNEMVDILTETVCTSKEYLTVAGDDYPAELVKSKLLKLEGEHIKYVLDCIKQNTSAVRNIKKYLLGALFNAPSTIDNYYSSKVNHDMYGL